MKKVKFLSQIMLFLWFGFMFILSAGLLESVKNSLPDLWLLYCVGILAILLLVDFLTNYKIKSINYIYPIYLTYVVIFNMAILRDWYGLSPLVNRFEHFFGTLIACFVILSLTEITNVFKSLAFKYKLVLLAGSVNLLCVLNEIVELGFDYFGNTENIGPDKFDTNLDLLFNLLAIGLFSIFYYLVNKRKKLS